MSAKEIGERLKAARLSVGASQERAAVAIGTTRATLGLYESGSRKVPATVVQALARLYATSADYLLALTDDPAPRQSGGGTEVVDLGQAAREKTVAELATEAGEDAERAARGEGSERRSSS